MATPKKIGSGGESALPANAPREARNETRPNHKAKATKTTGFTLEGSLLGSESARSAMIPIVSFFTFIYFPFTLVSRGFKIRVSYLLAYCKYYNLSNASIYCHGAELG